MYHFPGLKEGDSNYSYLDLIKKEKNLHSQFEMSDYIKESDLTAGLDHTQPLPERPITNMVRHNYPYKHPLINNMFATRQIGT